MRAARTGKGDSEVIEEALRRELGFDLLEEPARRSTDPGDDYLLALAEQEGAILVSGDKHLLELASLFPILTARAFLDRLDAPANT